MRALFALFLVNGVLLSDLAATDDGNILKRLRFGRTFWLAGTKLSRQPTWSIAMPITAGSSKIRFKSFIFRVLVAHVHLYQFRQGLAFIFIALRK